MATTYEDVLNLFRETDLQIKESLRSQQDTDRKFQDTDRKFQDTDRKPRRLGCRLFGNPTFKIGLTVIG